MPAVLVITLGCPRNQADSDSFERCFRSAGWDVTDDQDEADLILLNTCAFIRPAVEESVDEISSLLQWKRQAPGRKLILAGCLPGRYSDDGTGGLEEFELVTGPGETGPLESWLDLKPSVTPAFTSGGPARYLRIADGCSNRCAYCTIPLIRGEFRPVDRDTILTEAECLVNTGASEIGLVAQDSGMWSHGGAGLTELVEELARRYRETWWRVYYIHPAHFPDGLPGLIEDCDNVMPYIDMPIQHAQPEVLERMGRSYDQGDLHRIMKRLQDSSRKIAARITVIAGYPGETERDFRSLLEFLSGYSCIRNLVCFPYYPEEGTVEFDRATERGDILPAHVVSERISILSTLSEGLMADWGEWLTGREITVLADSAETGHTVWDAPFVDCRCVFTREVDPGSLVCGRVTGVSGSDVLFEPGPTG